MGSENLIHIDGHEFPFEDGETILQVAKRNEIDIPTLCHLSDASPTGGCKVCLVEVEGYEKLVTSCSTPCAPEMVVRTSSPEVIKSRRLSLEQLVASGNHNCLVQGMETDS